jgi:hypothetical protein
LEDVLLTAVERMLRKAAEIGVKMENPPTSSNSGGG